MYSNLYLDALQILEHISNRPGILGGMVLHFGKVLASQFSTELTKILTATDPVKTKTTGEVERNVNFHIPMGSQIIKVYIKTSEFKRLQRHMRKVDDSIAICSQNSQPLPFAIRRKSKDPGLKRDKSLIFPNIPEEEALIEVPSPDKMKSFSRPNHLPLKFKTIQTKELPESGIASVISFDETDSYADFIGRTSVCATPMTENKILCGPMPSIFVPVQLKEMEPQVAEEVFPETIEDTKKTFELGKTCINLECNPDKAQWKKSCIELNRHEVDIDRPIKNVYSTITDPAFPIFGERMQPLSKSLFDCYHNLRITDENFFKPPEQKQKSKMFEEKKILADPKVFAVAKPSGSPAKVSQTQKKKMMRLPIKSFSLDSSDTGKPSTSAASTSASIFDSPSTKTKKYTGNLQLTPLMSKLTMLAMSENDNFSSGFSSFDLPTPSYFDTPIDNPSRSLFSRLTKVEEEKGDENLEKEDDSDEMRRVDLFVCGQQNITLMIIAEENLMKSDQAMVQSMFDICVNRLSRLELKLNEIINVAVDLKASDYSFMNLDKEWDIIKRGGVWQQEDLATVLLMHDHFQDDSVSDVIIRTNDSVLYGHNKTGESEIYYQHSSHKQSSGGLAAPSDFTVIPQAKRRLERDHSLVLF
jgi:Hermansky-Pudlak syndrome 4 protein